MVNYRFLVDSCCGPVVSGESGRLTAWLPVLFFGAFFFFFSFQFEQFEQFQCNWHVMPLSVAESSHPSSTEHSDFCFTNTIKDGMNGFLNKATQVDIIHTECFGFPTTGSQFTGWSPPSEDMADCMNSLLCIY